MKKPITILALICVSLTAFSQGLVVIGSQNTTIVVDTNRAAVNLHYVVVADTSWIDQPCILKITGFTINGMDSLILDSGGKGSAVYLRLRGGTDFNYRFIPTETFSAEVTLTTTAKRGSYLLVNSTSGAKTVNPPANPKIGDWFGVIDSRGQSGTNNITVDFISASQKYHGSSTNAVLSTNAASERFEWFGTTIGWVNVR
jgi:hypothetical protein